MPTDALLMRPATAADAGPLAELYLLAREAAFPAMPRPVHDDDSVRAWVHRWFEPHATPVPEAWVAEAGERLVGFVMLEDDWVHSLYVDPELVGQGIGSALLDLAKGLRRGGLGLWVFESNEPARRFYTRHGFVDVRRTDGSDNEEREPDVEMRWEPRPTLAGLRGRIDEVDDKLAGLLAARARLTALSQQVKEVPGAQGRDPGREREIARRMARLAPELGEARLARIMDVVITESLEATGHGADRASGTDGADRADRE